MTFFANMLHYFNKVRILLRVGFYSWYYRVIFFINPAIKFRRDLRVSGILKLKIDPRSKVEFGKGMRINSGHQVNPFGGHRKMVVNVNKGGHLTIGNNVGMSSSTLVCTDSIVIEDHVLIGGGCQIFDSNFHPLKLEDRLNNKSSKVKSKGVTIAEGAFIGGGAFIGKGVRIGKNAIVGAGSVVYRSIPDNEIWSGNPAQFVKKND